MKRIQGTKMGKTRMTTARTARLLSATVATNRPESHNYLIPILETHSSFAMFRLPLRRMKYERCMLFLFILSSPPTYRDRFRAFGPLRYVRLAVDPETERPRGTGFA